MESEKGFELIRQGLAILAETAEQEIIDRLAAADEEAAGLTAGELIRVEVARAAKAAESAGASADEVVKTARTALTTASRKVRAAEKAAEKGGRGGLGAVLPTPPLDELGRGLLEFRKLIDGLEAEWSREFTVFCEFDGPRRVFGQEPATMLSQRCGMRSGQATARAKLASTWRRVPRCRELLREGKIGMGHLETVGETVADAVKTTAMDRDELAGKLDAVLTTRATGESPKQLAATAHEQAHRLDADAKDNKAVVHQRKRSCRLTLKDGGAGWELRASGEGSGYAIVRAALEALMFDRHQTGSVDRDGLFHCGGDQCGVPGADGGCTCDCLDCQPVERDQERYDALIRAFQTVASGAGLVTAGARERAKVQLVMTPDTLAGVPGAPPAETNYGQVLSRVSARALAEDAILQRLVMEPISGDLVDVGRAIRCFPARIAAAIKAKYRTCQYPGGCDVPVAYTDIHHEGIPWWDGGVSNESSGRPYCHAHNVQAEIDRLRVKEPGKAGDSGTQDAADESNSVTSRRDWRRRVNDQPEAA